MINMEMSLKHIAKKNRPAALRLFLPTGTIQQEPSIQSLNNSIKKYGQKNSTENKPATITKKAGK